MRFWLVLLMMFTLVSCGSATQESNDSDNVDADFTVVDEMVDDLSDEDSESEAVDETVEETVDEDSVYTPVVTDRVLLKTNMGNITIGLYENDLPETTANFKQYVTDEFYDGLIFHRIVPEFVIQAGGYDAELVARETRDSIHFEEIAAVKHLKYTISMARSTGIHTATSQFFITLDRLPHLDYTSYDDFLDEEKFPCVAFGIVLEGSEVVDKIAGVETEIVGGFEGVPVEPVVIESVVLIN